MLIWQVENLRSRKWILLFEVTRGWTGYTFLTLPSQGVAAQLSDRGSSCFADTGLFSCLHVFWSFGNVLSADSVETTFNMRRETCEPMCGCLS